MAYTPVYNGADLGYMAIDVAGGIMNGLAQQAGVMGVLIVIGIVIVLIVDLLTGIFGIVHFIRGVR